jgi:hypothetical protein
MAHAAARNAAVARILSGGPQGANSLSAPTPPNPGAPVPVPGSGGPMPPAKPHHSFKAHIAAAGAAHGVPLGIGDIHGAIDSLTQAGHFTPGQGAALKAHNGPLHGQAGVNTMHAITQHAIGMAGQGQ